VAGDPITVSEVDDGLGDTLWQRISEFNVDATGIDDRRALGVASRTPDGDLEGGLTGWTWGGCLYVENLWVREDLRGIGLGSRVLEAAEAEARSRDCAQVVVFSHTFQAPDFYLRRGYAELARIEDSPRGHADILFVKDLRTVTDARSAEPAG
jgi:GNAT superfamily N-acetyltransferase